MALLVAFSPPADALSPPSTSAATSGVAHRSPVAQDIVASRVTVTAARKNGDSAVLMRLFNGTAEDILLNSVTSPIARSDMVMIDNNMCMGTNHMIPLADIYIARGWTQKLGYKAQGAMLMRLRRTIKAGQHVRLSITWSEMTVGGAAGHTTNVTALVVKAPSGLQFNTGPSGMKM
jgi:copper(I)-binding protein